MYKSYSQMYKTRATSCLYTSKINIYNHPAFKPAQPIQICFLPIYPPRTTSNCTTCK